MDQIRRCCNYNNIYFIGIQTVAYFCEPCSGLALQISTFFSEKLFPFLTKHSICLDPPER